MGQLCQVCCCSVYVKCHVELINPPVSERLFTQHHCGMLIGSLDSLTRGIFTAACFCFFNQDRINFTRKFSAPKVKVRPLFSQPQGTIRSLLSLCNMNRINSLRLSWTRGTHFPHSTHLKPIFHYFPGGIGKQQNFSSLIG